MPATPPPFTAPPKGPNARLEQRLQKIELALIALCEAALAQDHTEETLRHLRAAVVALRADGAQKR